MSKVIPTVPCTVAIRILIPSSRLPRATVIFLIIGALLLCVLQVIEWRTAMFVLGKYVTLPNGLQLNGGFTAVEATRLIFHVISKILTVYVLDICGVPRVHFSFSFINVRVRRRAWCNSLPSSFFPCFTAPPSLGVCSCCKLRRTVLYFLRTRPWPVIVLSYSVLYFLRSCSKSCLPLFTILACLRMKGLGDILGQTKQHVNFKFSLDIFRISFLRTGVRVLK